MCARMKQGERTEDKVPDCVVVGHGPGQCTLREELDAGDPKRINIDLLREPAHTGHELWRLPS